MVVLLLMNRSIVAAMCCFGYKNALSILLLSLLFSVGAGAQSSFEDPYRLHLAVDVPIATVGLGSGIAYLVMDAQIQPLSTAYINGLDRTQISGFDRSATYHWSPITARISDGVMVAGMALPFLLLAQQDIRKTAPKIGLLYLETFAATAGLTNLTKVLTLRPRPYLFNAAVPWEEKQQKDAQYAFFSGHTSMTTAFCFLTAKIFHDYNPGHPARPWVWAGAATLSATAGVLRHQAGKHYWTDVIVGYAVGAAIGILIPELHRHQPFQPKTALRPNVEFSF